MKSLEFTGFKEIYLNEIIKLWNEDVVPKSIYKPWTESSFKERFLKNTFFDKDLFIILKRNQKMIGFGHGAYSNLDQTSPGYVTLVVVRGEDQNKGYGTLILKELELRLKEKGKTFIRELFLNPFNLSWYVSNQQTDDHPNAPGIPYHSPFYFFLLQNKYIIDGPNQDVFYQDIRSYEIPEHVQNLKVLNEKQGYRVTFYDQNKHTGFGELFKELNHEVWHQVVESNLKQKEVLPMLVIIQGEKIIGWSGPLKTEPSGRAYFAGIGIHPQYQGRGLGKVLFSELIYQSRLNGAQFMTLFTGSNNKARNIYLNAGFRIVQSFAIMRKDLL